MKSMHTKIAVVLGLALFIPACDSPEDEAMLEGLDEEVHVGGAEAASKTGLEFDWSAHAGPVGGGTPALPLAIAPKASEGLIRRLLSLPLQDLGDRSVRVTALPGGLLLVVRARMKPELQPPGSTNSSGFAYRRRARRAQAARRPPRSRLGILGRPRRRSYTAVHPPSAWTVVPTTVVSPRNTMCRPHPAI